MDIAKWQGDSRRFDTDFYGAQCNINFPKTIEGYTNIL